MPIDLGDMPIGTPPSREEIRQIRNILHTPHRFNTARRSERTSELPDPEDPVDTSAQYIILVSPWTGELGNAYALPPINSVTGKSPCFITNKTGNSMEIRKYGGVDAVVSIGDDEAVMVWTVGTEWLYTKFPSSPGTIALTSDIPSAPNLTGYQTKAGTLALGGFSGITGTLSQANIAALTGDVTKPSGSEVTTIGSGAITNAMLAGSIANTKLATDPLARPNHTGTQPLSTLSQSSATTGQVAQWNGSAWAAATFSSNLTSGPVTSSSGVSAIADAALSIAKTNGLQTALDGKASLSGATFLGNIQAGNLSDISGSNSGDNAENTNYASDYRAGNFVAGTNYLAPVGNGSLLTFAGDPDTGHISLSSPYGGIQTGINGSIKTADGGYINLGHYGHIRTSDDTGDLLIGHGTILGNTTLLSGPDTLGELDASALYGYAPGLSIGNADTATALATARTINGVSFNGTANITVTAAAGTLTGTTLASNVVASSLTSAAGGTFGTAAYTAASAYATAAQGVASLSLATPNVIFATPINFANTSGAWAGTLALNNQASNTVFGNFTAGSATPTFSASPTFAGGNITGLNATQLTSGTLPTAASVSVQTVGNGNATIAAGVREVLINAPLSTTPRTYTLPAASSCPAGSPIAFIRASTATGVNALISRAGSDTIDGSTSVTIIATGDAPLYLYSDGSTNWSVGTLPVLAGGTGVKTLTGLIKGNGTSGMTAAVAGTDYVSPSSTTNALGIGTIELGHASDTTLSRASAGRLAVEGVNVVTTSSTDTLTNKSLSGLSDTVPMLLVSGTSSTSGIGATASGSGMGLYWNGVLCVRVNAAGAELRDTGGSTTLTARQLVGNWNIASGNSFTFGGAVIATPQALSGAGAVNLTTTATDYTSTGAAEALTLANGTVGQIKTITHIVKGSLGTGVLTPTTKTGFSTITFNAAGDSVTLRYCTTAGWCVIGSFGVVIA